MATTVDLLSSSWRLICNKKSRSMATKLISSLSSFEERLRFLAGGELEPRLVTGGGACDMYLTGGGHTKDPLSRRGSGVRGTGLVR